MDQIENGARVYSKNWDYRLPYRELVHLRDIHEALDEDFFGTIKKDDLAVALRAAGMMISNEKLKDIIYEFGLEEEERVTMEKFFIIVANYKRDQTLMHGDLLDGTVLELPRVGVVKIDEVYDHSGNPFDPPSMLFMCRVIKQDTGQFQAVDKTTEYRVSWEFARVSLKVREYLHKIVDSGLSRSDRDLAALLPHLSTPSEEKAQKALRGAFLGVYTDVNPPSNLKKIYALDNSGKKIKNPDYVEPDEDDPNYSEKKSKEFLIRRIQQFIVPDEILKKKLCNSNMGEPLTDAEYDEFISLLPPDDEICVREHPDGPSTSKDMEGVLSEVNSIYRNFAYSGEEVNDIDNDDDDDDDDDRNGRDFFGESKKALARTREGFEGIEEEVEQDLRKAGHEVFKGFVGAGKSLQAGLDAVGLEVDIDALGILDDRKEGSDMGSAADSDFVESQNSEDSQDALSGDAESDFSSTVEHVSDAMSSLTGIDHKDMTEMMYLGMAEESYKYKATMVDNVSRAVGGREMGSLGYSVKSDKYKIFNRAAPDASS